MPAIKWDFGGMFIEIRNRLRVVFSSARGLNYFFHPPSIGHGCDEGSLSAAPAAVLFLEILVCGGGKLYGRGDSGKEV